jgi:hypothetical protein
MKLLSKKCSSVILLSFFVVGLFLITPQKADASCNISSVAVRPHGIQPISLTTVATPNDFPGENNPYRNQAHGYPQDGYDNANPGFPPHVYVDIETSGCQAGQGSTLLVAVISSVYYNQLNLTNLTVPGLGTLLGMFGGNDTVAFQSLYHIGPGTPQPAGYNTTSDSFTVDLRAGETNCSSIVGYDCQYFFLVYGNNGAIAHLAGTGAAPELEYDCDDVDCLDAWSGGGIIPFGQTTDLPGNAIDPNYESDYFSEGSELPLAPLPGVNPNAISTLGGFLKALFTVLIVIAGVLAFIMIVIGGVIYATSDAFSDKSSGKEMILNAILGLIIALGSWVILNTINPNLASNLSITVPKVTLDVPRQEWQNGNAAAGTNIAEGITLNGQPITQGMPWPDDALQRGQLNAAGITVTSSGNSNCAPTAGTPGCTSVYFEGTAAGVIQQIITLKTSCNCEIVVTGGSEAWLHQTHGPNVKVVDMRATDTLNTYLNTQNSSSLGSGFPTGKWITINGVGKFWAEPTTGSQGASEHHWHVIFN